MGADFDERGEALRRAGRTGRQVRQDIEAEIEFHVEMRARELERGGLSPAAAREEALRRFGDVEVTRQVCAAADLSRERRVRRREFATSLRQDVQFAVRHWLARPLSAASAVLVLALSTGATTAVFGVVDHVVFRPLPYVDPGDVLVVRETDLRTGERLEGVSPADYLEVERNGTLFVATGLAEPFSYDVALRDGPPESMAAWLVTSDYFEALGVRPLVGRLFTPADYLPDGTVTDAHLPPPAAVVVSEALWRRLWAGDPGAIGGTLELDGRPATVIGVLPASATFPSHADLWTPKSFRRPELQERRSTYMTMVARVRPGVTQAQAQAELDRIARASAAEYPASNRETGFAAASLGDVIVGPVRRGFSVLLGVAAFVLLIACASVAGLLLARGADRGRELAVRASLGAGHGRLAQQLLTEALVIGVAGGVLGFLAAHGGLRLLIAMAPAGLPRVGSATLDLRVLAFLIAVTLAATALAGVAPAVRLARPDLMAVLRRGAGGGLPRARLRSALVGAEIALAFVLLIGAGLLLRSYVQLTGNDLGFEPQGTAQVQLFLWDRNPTAAARMARLDEILDRVRALPGVTAAGAASAVPFHPGRIGARGGLHVEGRAPAEPGEEDRVPTIAVTPDYFAALGVPLRAGRIFTPRDDASAARVAIVNEAFVRRYFPGEVPTGRRIAIGYMGAPVSREVVGVVGDVRMDDYRDEAEPQVFIPVAETGTGSVTVVARGAGPGGSAGSAASAGALLALLREQVWAADPGQSIYHSSTLDDLVAAAVAAERFQLLLVATFSALALLLAALGIYGLIGTIARGRVREFGVRLALGARPPEIMRLMVASGLRLALPGVVAGVIAALLLTRLLGSLLYATSPTEPATFAQIIALMVAVCVLAAWLPARQVLSRDPVRSLREE